MMHRASRMRTRIAAAIAASLLAVMCMASVAQAQNDDADTGYSGVAEAPATGVLDGDVPDRYCAGTAIVVASDEAARSDVYSAVTLAGVIGSECIVLAGARNADMSPLHRALLDRASAGGWIVGGIAAVPESKTRGRSLKRIAGSDRWHTARLVGAIANNPEADLGLLHNSVSAWNPVADEADCSGKIPIVVASDAAAASDLYSAATLAGVLGTDCIIFGGPRASTMPTAQRARLADAQSGGWIIGGTTAVPPAKTAGRSMRRIAGDDRWETALLVGVAASNPNDPRFAL